MGSAKDPEEPGFADEYYIHTPTEKDSDINEIKDPEE